jgi:plastocyanin domain-containing protein
VGDRSVVYLADANEFKIQQALPLNQPVDIEFMPQRNGEIEFVCGMNMFKGTIVVQ